MVIFSIFLKFENRLQNYQKNRYFAQLNDFIFKIPVLTR